MLVSEASDPRRIQGRGGDGGKEGGGGSGGGGGGGVDTKTERRGEKNA